MLAALPCLMARHWLDDRLWAGLLTASARWQAVHEVPITLVAIDETSIDTLGPWPWPRERWAELIRRLHAQHRPALVALDAVFPPVEDQQAGNAAFAHAMAASPAVVGQLLLPDPGMRGAPSWALERPIDGAFPDVLVYPGMLGSVQELAATATLGHINAAVSRDGIMRHAPTLLCNPDGRCAMSFMQAMVAALTGNPEWQVRQGQWHEADWMIQPGNFPSLALPADEQGRLLVPWREPTQLPYVTAASIWNGTVPARLLDHRIMLFGGVSLGLGDLITTPLHTTLPGMEVHASLLASWLTGDLPYRPRYAQPLLLAWCLLTVLAMASARMHTTRRLAVLTGVATTLPLAGAAGAWVTWQAVWPATPAALFVLLTGSLLLVTRAIRDRQLIMQRLGVYLPQPLRRFLGRSDATIPTETGWGTVMVADIEGYTAQSHKLGLAELARWCDAGIGHVVHHAQAHGAMLDNVAGDGALLLWRTGTDGEQAEAALDAAFAIVQGFPALNERLRAEGLPPLSMGIGIHAGPYLLGSFGTTQKRYTVVSEVANLAAHIERQTRHHRWPVLLSETVASAQSLHATKPVGSLDKPGSRSIPLYTLANIAEKQ